MRVLYCVSEVAPIIKVGGLGDVAGSLPKALARLGVEMEVVVPKYEEIKTMGDFRNIGDFGVEFGGKEERVIVWQTTLPESSVPVYLLENETYLSKNGHKAFAGTEKEVERFAFFSKAIAELIKLQVTGYKLQVDLLHLNDWHTSLVPLLLASASRLPSILTIHNLSYQGISGLDLLAKFGLKPNSCKALKWDAQNRDIDILMEGIIHATLVNTVSPAYSKEIMTPEFGWGIEGVLKGKEGRVVGILNGIDYRVWDPTTDELINFQFSIFNFQLGKTENKKFLQKELELNVDEKIPFLAFISRLEPQQKGLDILYEAMEKLLPEGSFQFVLLGVGDREWEKRFKVQSASWRTRFKVNMRFINKFDERLAHQIYAGADIILMPSKFEPCGLPQMIGMRYGALPLVRKTGGLADTVVEGKTGFVFEEYSGQALVEKIRGALDKVKSQKAKVKMVKAAMSQDFSWEASARKYLELYKRAMALHNS